MPTTMTRKGQVTVPKKIRDYLGLAEGSAVNFALGPFGEVIVKPVGESPPVPPAVRFAGMRGSLRTGKTTDDLMGLLRDYDGDAKDPGL